jgi:hypothetical protein
MKKYALVLLLISLGCGGNLSEEQRKKFKEGMEGQKIVRITDAEIMTAAMEKGGQVYAALNGKNLKTSAIDSLEETLGATIHFSVPGGTNTLAIEQELIEAYVAGMTQGGAPENLQKIYVNERKDEYDTLLYSKPQVTVLADGTERLDGIWNIYLPKKSIVLAISKNK